jgi:tetratricopeptide (TPR) repeat protein
MRRQLGLSWVPLYPLLDLGRLCLAEGAWADASRYLEEGMALAERRGDLLGRRYLETALAERDVLEGRPDAACARLVSVLEHHGQLEWGEATLLALLAWAYLELGEIGQAAEVVGQAITRARATNNRLGSVDALRVQAMVLIRHGRWAEAASSLEEGLALARNMPYPHGEGHLLHVYGTMHVQKGELEPARERLEAALANFRRLGAQGHRARGAGHHGSATADGLLRTCNS